MVTRRRYESAYCFPRVMTHPSGGEGAPRGMIREDVGVFLPESLIPSAKSKDQVYRSDQEIDNGLSMC